MTGARHLSRREAVGEPAVFRLRGTSMMPLIGPGSTILVDRSVEASRLRPGQIVAVRHPRGGIVLHRFVRRLRDGRLVTRGDAQPVADQPWDASSLVGLLVAVRGQHRSWVCPKAWTEWVFPLVLRIRPFRLACALCFLLTHRSIAMKRWKGRMDSRKPQLGSVPKDCPSGRFEIQKIGAEMAIHDQSNGSLHLLNETAAHVWEARSLGLGADAIVARMAVRYPEVAVDRLRSDVSAVLADLDLKGL